ncbi:MULTISPECIES: hypothetical protein [unclassified Herbaspirillum]|uniref:hypothetical protein n=1 Tax=unclassified Herbaspirillum TaxID=2624150 RepID=UPI00114F5961|nr:MULTISPECIES: hypothetical protein [unclassified Herbaspirillum]MBB5393425.1 hypothetical protein [Herbaspirillum sp. SJZ102]TQK03827.1 hypothetical protein FB599_3393 [Herbaspirillum sp. SJZ130]TQK08559.1 hypothetical protein FB598_3332 [Herbaspirillum sp. SJZ106]TWC71829.1 hypothetical protein FB597_101810 [Herbaspirillum sp. SJZ099]
MHQPDFLIPRFARMLAMGMGSLIAMPVAPASPASDEQERRRSHSAHEPAVKQAASDNEPGRDIVEDDARKLAEQNKTVRNNERNKEHDKQDRKREAEIDQALADTFPASDAVDRSSGS